MFEVVFTDLKILIQEAKKFGLRIINPSKSEIVFLNDQSVAIRQRIMNVLNLGCYGFGIRPIEDLVFLGSPVGYRSTIALFRKKTEKLHTFSKKLQNELICILASSCSNVFFIRLSYFIFCALLHLLSFMKSLNGLISPY